MFAHNYVLANSPISKTFDSEMVQMNSWNDIQAFKITPCHRAE